MQTDPKIVGKARSYRDFVAILRAFFEEKQISRETLDAHCGLQGGYAAKLLTPIPIKNFGMTSLTMVLAECGLEVWIVQRTDSIDDMPKRRHKRTSLLALEHHVD